MADVRAGELLSLSLSFPFMLDVLCLELFWGAVLQLRLYSDNVLGSGPGITYFSNICLSEYLLCSAYSVCL